MAKKTVDSTWSQTFCDFLIFVGVLAAVFAMWWFAKEWIDSNITGPTPPAETSAQARGLFGDQFGAVNSLFSGLAFAGIIITILLQRRDLIHTRTAFELQTKSTDQQRFDNTFFNLIALHNDIIKNLDVTGQLGRKSFSVLNERIKQSDPDFPAFSALSKLKRDQIRRLSDSGTITEGEFQELNEADVANIEASLRVGTSGCNNYLDENVVMHETKIKSAYTKSAVVHIDNFSHYFRNLYHILLFVDSSPLIDDGDRSRYAKIIRSQLSEAELVTIFYNSLTKIELPGRETMELGYPKMGKLLVKYDLLQNMSPRSLIHPLHQQIFDKNNGVHQ